MRDQETNQIFSWCLSCRKTLRAWRQWHAQTFVSSVPCSQPASAQLRPQPLTARIVGCRARNLLHPGSLTRRYVFDFKFPLELQFLPWTTYLMRVRNENTCDVDKKLAPPPSRKSVVFHFVRWPVWCSRWPLEVLSWRPERPERMDQQNVAENSEKSDTKAEDEEDDSCAKFLLEELRLNPTLLPYKVFYFVFFAGFGLWPYLPLYFKQLGLSASEAGLLAGIRPIIQFIGSPFWSLLADKFKARKGVLLFSIIAWLVMTLSLLIPVPRKTYCEELGPTNVSALSNSSADFPHAREKRRASFLSNLAYPQADKMVLKLDSSPQPYLEESEISGTRKLRIFQIHRDEREITNVFMWLLLLTVTGEFLEVPSFIMADTALLQALGKKVKDYGKTRLFGSVGFAVSSFAIGGLLDSTQYKYCGRQMNNYNVVFYFFAAVMASAFLLAAWAFKFDYEDDESTAEAERSPSSILKVFSKFDYAFCITITWFLGFNHGLLFNFLNWYLEDLGASKSLMGTGVLCRAVSLSVAFFFHSFITDICGHLSLILWAVGSYTFLFFSFSAIINPWWAIPLELYHGLVFGTAWSTLVVFLAKAASKEQASTMQGTQQHC